MRDPRLDDRDAKIIEMRLSGKSRKQVAYAFGITGSRVSQIMVRWRLQQVKDSWDEMTQERLKQT